MRWVLVGLCTLAAVGCSDGVGRYQPVPTAQAAGWVRMALDTKTGRLCLAVLPGTDTGTLTADKLCDPSLYYPKRQIDALADTVVREFERDMQELMRP